MNLARYNQPLPPRLGQLLLFLNAVVGLLVGHSLLADKPETAAYVALAAGVLNQAVQIFCGQNPNPTHEQSTDSTLSDRRERVRKEKAKARYDGKRGEA